MIPNSKPPIRPLSHKTSFPKDEHLSTDRRGPVIHGTPKSCSINDKKWSGFLELLD